MFLDVNMPSMTGFEFLDEFKKFDEEVQNQFSIYTLSSSIEDFNIQATQYPIVKGFLSKPLKVSYLEEIHQEIKEDILSPI
ncbi:MAG: response regulator [Gillisia sp.]